MARERRLAARMEAFFAMLAVTIESVLFVLVILGAIGGLVGYRIYATRRRVTQWRKGHGPGHESFLELPYNRDQVFQIAQECLAQDYEIYRVARIERLVLGERKGQGGRPERVTVRVDPTLQGCEVIFVRLGPGWKSVPAGSNSPEAEHFFNGVSSRLGHVGPGGHVGGAAVPYGGTGPGPAAV